MDKKRINISICGRNYPLNINPDEEFTLRKVGKSIEEMIKFYESNFDIRDKQDALAMCAIKLGTNAEIHNNTANDMAKELNQELSKLIEVCNAKSEPTQ